MTNEQWMRDQVIAKAGEDAGFHADLLLDPKHAIRDTFDINLPTGLNVHVHQDTDTCAHIVIPPSDKLTLEEMDAVSGAGMWDYGGTR